MSGALLKILQVVFGGAFVLGVFAMMWILYFVYYAKPEPLSVSQEPGIAGLGTIIIAAFCLAARHLFWEAFFRKE